ncbi:MAG: nitrous oxide reductase accessory protein NosL [Gemmatimonadaceae bacterium]|nr:nitrous oxide reductase accessory protein NosL [Gemmatimonadaceae bacterium]
MRVAATVRHAALLLSLATAIACDSDLRPLVPGTDACGYCRMTIDDVRFGALVKTAKGRLETFDSIECAASYVATLAPALAPQGIWVADFDHPSHWLDARKARFVQSSQLRSPMGRELAAFSADSTEASLAARFGGRSVSWTDVLTQSRTKLGLAPRHGQIVRPVTWEPAGD